jgi:hypothetical protein
MSFRLQSILTEQRRKSLLLKETLREREGFANDLEVSALVLTHTTGKKPPGHEPLQVVCVKTARLLLCPAVQRATETIPLRT